jgi:hypothetical protein
MSAQDDNGRAAFNLFLISFLTLFGEVAFIRYLSSNIYLLSYYKNSVLIAVFLGIGIGVLRARDRRNYIEYLPVAGLALVALVVNFNDYLRIDLDYASKDESIWPEFWANRRARGVPLLGVLAVFYVLMTLYFIPFGQETMRAMARFRPLKAYSINVAGALAGVAAFAVAGWLWTTPLVWFSVLLIPLLWWSYMYSGRVVLALNVLAVALTLFLVFSGHWGPEVWSPYSRIRVYQFGPDPALGFISTTNGNPQVGCMNLDIEYPGPEGPLNMESKRIYGIPYRFRAPSRVMVAGAGAGNEVAMALRNGAEEVDAVEIDPVFVTLGRELNPHRPFSDPRVKVFVDDARAFFHKATAGYDLIVIGFLDSQYHLTHMTNIRTENFVYTYESLRRTRELLSAEGILQLNYNAPRRDMRVKLYMMLKEIYGDDLLVYVPVNPVSGNISYLAGPGMRGVARDVPGMSAGALDTSGVQAAFPTDDWPFLYLDGMRIPREYWPMLLVIPLISLVMLRGAGGTLSGFSPKYFLLGLGFMLLETKSITSFALLFGSTVTVVSIVLASIMAAILVANYVVSRFGVFSLKAPYALIIATIAGLYLAPLGAFIGLPWAARLAVSVFLIAAPIFFAAMIFAVSFAGSRRMDAHLGSNILGAVVGGMSEYMSMAIGFNGLYILSLLAYLAAFAIDAFTHGLDVRDR